MCFLFGPLIEIAHKRTYIQKLWVGGYQRLLLCDTHTDCHCKYFGGNFYNECWCFVSYSIWLPWSDVFGKGISSVFSLVKSLLSMWTMWTMHTGRNCFNLFQILFSDWLSANTGDAHPGVSWVSNDQKFIGEFKNTQCQVDHPPLIE